MVLLKILYRLYGSLQGKICKIYFVCYTKLLCNNIIIGKRFKSNGFISVSISRECKITFGDDIIFNNRVYDNYVGLNKKSTIALINNGKLTVGNNTGFSNVSIYCANEITIGSYCNFGGNCFIWDTDFHQLDYLERRTNANAALIKTLPIHIGNDVFIGANCIILKGVTIGNRAIIGAGSVVSKSILDDEIWAGNPIKFIRKINNDI